MFEEFDKYVKNYDLTNRDIKLKYNHSIRVMNLSKKYAKLIGFNESDVELATLIGLLHDIGRFEQLKVYHSYDDSKTIDHADYGVKILFDDGLITMFTNNKEDYPIIRDAIKYHNKLEVPKLDDRTTKFAKLIRDIDKMDIVYLMGKLNEEDIHSTNDALSPKVLEAVKEHRCINLRDLNNDNDHIAIVYGFPFDINYDECVKEFKTNLGYYYDIVNDDKFKELYEIDLKYMNERIDHNARN